MQLLCFLVWFLVVNVFVGSALLVRNYMPFYFLFFYAYCFNIISNDARFLSYNEIEILSICPIILTIA